MIDTSANDTVKSSTITSTPIASPETTSASSLGAVSGFWLYGVAGVAIIGAIAVMTAASPRSRRS